MFNYREENIYSLGDLSFLEQRFKIIKFIFMIYNLYLIKGEPQKDDLLFPFVLQFFDILNDLIASFLDPEC